MQAIRFSSTGITSVDREAIAMCGLTQFLVNVAAYERTVRSGIDGEHLVTLEDRQIKTRVSVPAGVLLRYLSTLRQTG